MNLKQLLLVVVLSAPCHGVFAQPTLGTLFYQSNTDTGYLLMAPSISNQTWLIDNCGREVHRWDSDAPPALSVHLLEDGSLLRPARISNSFNAGGTGGLIDRLDWDGLQTWRFTYSADTGHQHHDICPLPNGNVLVLAWEKHTIEKALALGRKPETLFTELWSEKIVELRPVGPNQAEYVWSWRLWDHLVQDQDPLKPNFGNPADFPGRVDINYLLDEGPESYPDWTHANSVDFNPELNQVLISVRNFHELWVIDHSTTRAEAVGSTGGNSGRGGDLLYRWGNPQAYGRGDSSDQVFFQQHDASWIPPGLPGEGHILVFNNGKDRPGVSYSSVEEILPPLEADGNYTLNTDQPYGPAEVIWRYVADPPEALISKNLSGAQRQPNGNTLICSGGNGRVIEVTPDGNTTWEYICPVGAGGPLSQGSIPSTNQLFQLSRYPVDYPGLSGRDLSPGATVQVEVSPPDCEIIPVYSGSLPEQNGAIFQAGPNPFSTRLWVLPAEKGIFHLTLVNSTGTVFYSESGGDDGWVLQTHNWPVGIYVALLQPKNRTYAYRTTLIKSGP